MAAVGGLEVRLRYLRADGGTRVVSVDDVDAASVLQGLPVRRPPTYRGQKNYPGLFWSVTTNGFLIYESLLELDRLWIADFDVDVSWIATQPFEVTGRVDGRTRRHVPDLMLGLTTGKVRVADVKPAGRLVDPDVAKIFTWTGGLCAGLGWEYEVWSGSKYAVLRNIKFLGSCRRRVLADACLADSLLNVFTDGQTIAETIDSVVVGSASLASVRPTLFHLMWRQALVGDLTAPLTERTVLRRGPGVVG